jgi:hypothetical protein
MLSPDPSGVLEINIVQHIVAPCPTEFDSLPTPQRRSDPHGVYPWMGCSAISGKVSVLGLVAPKEITGQRRYRRWIDHEGVLWAHEISHLLGLDDLEPDLLSKLPRLEEGAGWLMMPPYIPTAVALFPEECDVLMNYPANQPQLQVLQSYLDNLSAPEPKALKPKK